MRQHLMKVCRWGAVAGVGLIPRAAQAPQPSDNSLVIAIVLAVAILGPIILGAGFAFVSWLISRGTPPAAVGAAPPKPARPREVVPPGVHLPPPSIRPLIIAVGMTIMAFGIILRGLAIDVGGDIHLPIILLLGVLIFGWGLIGWVRDDWRAARH
jgi:hypothetical protein